MLISISIQKDYIYYIIFIILKIFYSLMQSIISSTNIYLFLYHICGIFLIIFYIIEKHSSDDYNFMIKKNKFIYEKTQNKKNNFKIISLIAFLIIFYVVYDYKFSWINFKLDYIEYYITIVLLLIIIEIFFFKKYIYSHQIISIIMIIILSFFKFGLKFLQSPPKLIHILVILKYYCYCFNLYLLKYMDTKYFINIYLLSCITSIFRLIQYLIENFNILIPELKNNNILNTLYYFFTILIDHFLIYKVIIKLGPIHGCMCNILSYVVVNFIILKNDRFIMILLIISSLIYLEVLELNFYGLNKNIKKNIEKRGEEDKESELSNEDKTKSLNDSNFSSIKSYLLQK